MEIIKGKNLKELVNKQVIKVKQNYLHLDPTFRQFVKTIKDAVLQVLDDKTVAVVTTGLPYVKERYIIQPVRRNSVHTYVLLLNDSIELCGLDARDEDSFAAVAYSCLSAGWAYENGSGFDTKVSDLESHAGVRAMRYFKERRRSGRI